MAFVLARPPSPSPRETQQQIDQDEWALATPFHAMTLNPAASATASTSTSTHYPPDDEMGREKDKQRLDINLDTSCLHFKGTGTDVEPALLSGHVSLYLAEPASVKEITLQFRGKARLPIPPSESISLNNSPVTYVLCNHEWSFLEGEKKHSHRLKAGLHVFPFQLQIGGALPSSFATNASGGASIAYKLRAHVVRPGFNHNLEVVMPVSIIRTFTPEALEYQQTLEIENTWPEKLMYSIMIPHKAWAIGDRLAAVFKFTPLAKGVRVLTVTSTINETTKLYAKSGPQEHTQLLGSVIYDIAGGHPVEISRQELRRRSRTGPGSSPHYPSTPTGSIHGLHTPTSAVSQEPPVGMMPSSTLEQSASLLSVAEPSSSTSSTHNGTINPSEEAETAPEELTSQLSIVIPYNCTPTHSLDPIIVSHRIRWSILIGNLDGHTSELRCSLPIHLLDPCLLDEARQHTAATRRLLLGPGTEVSSLQDEEDTELPSYTAHVRDRVANMYLPDAATMRVANPWVLHGTSPTVLSNESQNQSGVALVTSSGISSPLEAPTVMQTSHLPNSPPVSGTSTPLDWVNSELLLSLSDNAPRAPSTPTGPFPETHSENPATATSSGLPSRPSSPERQHSVGNSDGGATVLSPLCSHETYIHSGPASRQLHALLSISMKPLTYLTHHHWLPSSRSSFHSSSASHAHAHSHGGGHHQTHYHSTQQSQVHPPTRTASIPLPDPEIGSALLHRAFTEVPDYAIASRGFIGGVPPLDSMRGLPSYDEAERDGHSSSTPPIQ